ncbi:hypothetical protein RIVM261_078400 [Rivularia sp. IAM M-261]|nr:hypothetical protein RIVM261_078400 [Rivularia sp. IAM M-261]
MNFKKLTALTTALTLTVCSGAEAQSKRLLYEGSYDGAAQQVYILNKKLVRQQNYEGAKERLFKVNYEIQARSLAALHSNPNRKVRKDIQRYSQLVNCSTARPFVASKSYLDGSKGEGFLTLITPWEDPGDIRMSNSRLVWKYWDVCHNVRDAARFDLTQTAKRYGYRGNYEVKDESFPPSLQQYLK